MLSARAATAATSPATSPLWKRNGGGGEGGSSANRSGCTSYREVRRRAASVRVRAAAPRRVEAVAMESAAETEKEVAVASGAVEDKYGEDMATEEVPVTPWAFSVAR